MMNCFRFAGKSSYRHGDVIGTGVGVMVAAVSVSNDGDAMLCIRLDEAEEYSLALSVESANATAGRQKRGSNEIRMVVKWVW